MGSRGPKILKYVPAQSIQGSLPFSEALNHNIKNYKYMKILKLPSQRHIEAFYRIY